MLSKELKETKESYWRWRSMTDDEFELMNDEFEKHTVNLPHEEQYYMIKAIEREHTKHL
jgi:hypothetical protein